MADIQRSMFDVGDTADALNNAIQVIKDWDPIAQSRGHGLGYVVGYSGGKDSDALVRLFQIAGVHFTVFHNHTTLDAPETVYYVRKRFKELEEQGVHCVINIPKTTFWKLCIRFTTLPLRRIRFCCGQLKEYDPPEFTGCAHAFGVRKAESIKRAAKRDSIELNHNKDYSDMQRFSFDNVEEAKEIMTTGDKCMRTFKNTVNPMAYWNDDYLAAFIEDEVSELNPLYCEGFKRVGCVGCPMAKIEQRKREFARWPKFKDKYIQVAQTIVDIRKEQGKITDQSITGLDYFEAWLDDNPGRVLGWQKENLFNIAMDEQIERENEPGYNPAKLIDT